ncbi:hypothetical protein HG66A1_52510 [Gimesia chilikensis]|uniref:Uncharacterized protein n=1 Tax=Gimesia chilikensis TaxID=2605989 RepID=A0A517PVP1_9PLAN|nr:hypothetical protein HG66A1_52510 [Gimesia chilikensis]
MLSMCSDFRVSVLRSALKVLRNDLKCYETEGTGDECPGEKLEKSTAIQVVLSHLFGRFQCTHHPPRARSTIAPLYDSGRADQEESVQFLRQKFAGNRDVSLFEAGTWVYHIGAIRLEPTSVVKTTWLLKLAKINSCLAA